MFKILFSDIGYLTRKAILYSHPDVEIAINGEHWTILTHLPVMTLNYTFALGEPVMIRNPSRTSLVSVYLWFLIYRYSYILYSKLK